jgi:hypothetical protein
VPLSVVAASLAGSAHCALMCGPLVAVVNPDRRSEVLYHAGRAVGYAGLGTLAGLLGRSLFDPRLGALASWLASAALGTALISLGVGLWSGGSAQFGVPSFFGAAFRRSAASASEKGGLFSALCGLASILLPCGWLHSFVLAAAATRSPWSGGLVLFFFWLGSLPALTVGVAALKKTVGLLGARAPRAAAVLLIAAGVAAIGARGYRAYAAGRSAAGEAGGMLGCHCHLPGAAP